MQGSQPARILCLDDDTLGLSVRKALLEYAGYSVLTADCPEQALEKFASEPVDLVITDHFLTGTLGTKVAAVLKRMHSDVPVMLLSGGDPELDGNRCIDAFLLKTEPPRVLLKRVAELLGASHRSAAQQEHTTPELA